MNIDMVYEALEEAIALFDEGLEANFRRENIIIELFDENSKFEVFEAFCKKHFPYRLSDSYREEGYFDFRASAFVGKDNGGIDGILVRTDIDYMPNELRHTLLHELAHIYCVHDEFDGKDFFDLYCNGIAPTTDEDEIINTGYAIWRECIAEVIAIELDDTCYITPLSSKKKYLSSLIDKIDPNNGKLAMSMILTAVMTSEEVEESKEWKGASNSLARLKLFEEPMFHDIFEKVFLQLRNGFCEIDFDFIFEIGTIYLNLLSVQTIKNCKLFSQKQ